MNNLLIRSFLTTILVLLVTLSCTAQGWFNTYPDPSEPVQAGGVIQTPDNGFMMTGIRHINDEEATYLIVTRVDYKGDTLWTKRHEEVVFGRISKMLPANDGGYLIAGSTWLDDDFHTFKVAKLDPTGEVEWQLELDNIGTGWDAVTTDILQNEAGEIFLLGQSNMAFEGEVILSKITATGTLTWSVLHESQYSAPNMRFNSEGDIAVVGYHNPPDNTNVNDSYLWIFDKDDGSEKLWKTYEEDTVGSHIVVDNDGFLWLIGFVVQNSNGYFSFRKLDAAGNEISSNLFLTPNNEGIYEVLVLEDNTFLIGGLFANSTFYLRKINPTTGEDIWTQYYPDLSLSNLNATHYIQTNDGGFAITGYLFGGAPYVPFLAKTDSEGFIYTNQISGQVAYDLDENCELNADEVSLKNWLVKIQGEDSFYKYTDQNGEYSILVDTGNYEVNVIPPSNVWATCPPEGIDFADFFGNQTADLPVQAAVDCGVMNVNISSNVLRRCFERNYHVSYCNTGTITSENVYIEVEIDSLLEIVGASIPIANQDDNTLIFEIGDVEFNECGNFTITVYTPCDIDLGLWHCSEAHIYPDTFCMDANSDWSGASIEVRGMCEDDELVSFEIENVGNAPMDNPLEFIVIEDIMILMQEPFDLGPGDILPIDLDATGLTYILTAEQEPDHPGLSMPMTFVQGCGGFINPSDINSLPLDDGNFFTDIDCRPNVDSYDPNDKQASPSGWGDEHFLEPNIDIEYLIRFQNEGTDTAFRVVVLDTLPQELDITTFHEMSFSFPYQLEINTLVSGRHELRYTFTDINLLPKSVDEAASTGFLRYTISQQTDLPIGTVIQNRAGIYFDFNPPVMTEYAFHTIGVNFIDIINTTQNIDNQSFDIQIMPHPVSDIATLKIPELANQSAQFMLLNAQGKALFSQSLENGELQLERGQLPAGIYFFQVQNAKGTIASGKLIIR